MLRDRFLQGASFAPLYAPDEGAGGTPAGELPLGAPPGGADPAAAAAAPGDVDASEWDKLPAWAKRSQGKWRDKAQELENQLASERAETLRLKEMVDAQRRSAAAPGAATPAGSPAPASPPAPAAAAIADDDDDPRIEQRAQQLAADQSWARSMNDLNNKGAEIYGAKWNKAIDDLKNLGGFDKDTLNQIAATDNPAKVLYELGTQPQLYQRIMDIGSPAKRGFEFYKIASTPAPALAADKGKKPSDAPAPVDAVGGRGGATDNNDVYDKALDSDAHDDEWYRRRRAQKLASTGRPWSPPLGARV
jgi:hypothetical protein